MPLESTRLLTVEDLYDLPEDGRRYELVEGYLLSEPLPGPRHGRVIARIVHLLVDHVDSHQLGEVIAADSGFILARSPDTVRGPDVAFVARERYDAAGDPVTAFPGAPDLAVEVVSPSSRPADVHGKVADYLAAGTKLVWVVDPAAKTVTVYRTLLQPRTLGGEDRLEGEDVLPGFSVAAADCF